MRPFSLPSLAVMLCLSCSSTDRPFSAVIEQSEVTFHWQACHGSGDCIAFEASGPSDECGNPPWLAANETFGAKDTHWNDWTRLDSEHEEDDRKRIKCLAECPSADACPKAIKKKRLGKCLMSPGSTLGMCFDKEDTAYWRNKLTRHSTAPSRPGGLAN